MFKTVSDLKRDIAGLEVQLEEKKRLLSCEVQRLHAEHGNGPHDYFGEQVRLMSRGTTWFMRAVGGK